MMIVNLLDLPLVRRSYILPLSYIDTLTPRRLRGLVLYGTCETDSDVLAQPFHNFTEFKKCDIWPQFSTTVALDV